MRFAHRAATTLLIGIGCLLAPGTAAATSFVSGSFNHTFDLRLGASSPLGGNNCETTGWPTDVCRIQGTHTPPVFANQSTNQSYGVSTGLGSDTVRVSTSAGVANQHSASDGFRVDHSMSLGLRDSEPTSFHTTASAYATFASTVVVDTASILLPGDTLELTIRLSFSFDELFAILAATYQVVDLDTNLTLASFSETSPGSTTLDFSGLVGHRLAISFDGWLWTDQPAGFAGGATGLTNRSYSYSINARTELDIIHAIPEPSSGAMLALGLLALAGRPIRRAC